MTNPKIFSKRLSELIVDNNLNAESLSKAINHNVFDIYHWLSGTSKFMPSVSALILIADYFNCSIDFLVGLESDNFLTKPNKNRPPFSERFPFVVKEKKSNFYRLAKAAKFSSTSVLYDWANGKKEPRIDSLIAVAAALNCSIDYLIGREL